MSNWEDRDLTARKVTAYLPVSDEMLMDAGAIPDTRPPLPNPPLRRRIRWWVEVKRERIGEIIAGRRFEEGDDW